MAQVVDTQGQVLPREEAIPLLMERLGLTRAEAEEILEPEDYDEVLERTADGAVKPIPVPPSLIN